jgi:acyl carrier protein
MPETLDRLQSVFRDTFNNDRLVLRLETTAGEVEGWDSLMHIDLIVAIEREFKMRFTTAEVTSLKNVGDLAALVEKKRAPKA